MFPTLIELGPFKIHTYGVWVALAFVLGLRVAILGARQRQIPENFILDLTALSILTGIFGARLLYVLQNTSYFSQNVWDVFKVWQGGLVYYGGFIVAAGAGVWLSRKRGQPVARVADAVAPALAFGHALGRIGCFFAGCCYGKPTDFFCAVRFTHPDALAPLGIGLHPTQLYEAVGTALLGVVLWLRLTRRPHDAPGTVFWWYVLGYGLLRFGIEMLRGDLRGGPWAGLYPSQWLALCAVLMGGSMLILHASAKEDGHS